MVSTAKISSYLAGMEFPASKEQIIAYAKGRQAPPDVLEALKKMRGGNFYTLAGVWDAVGVAA